MSEHPFHHLEVPNLEEDLTPHERERWDTFVANKPANGQAFTQQCRMWEKVTEPAGPAQYIVTQVLRTRTAQPLP